MFLKAQAETNLVKFVDLVNQQSFSHNLGNKIHYPSVKLQIDTADRQGGVATNQDRGPFR